MSERIRSSQEPPVYAESCALGLAVFKPTQVFPREEMYSLSDQARRSSRSIGVNLAEAGAKRRYPAHFVSKRTDADGERQKIRRWIGRALAYGYLPAVAGEGGEARDPIGGMLGKMIQNPEAFA